MSLRVSDVEQRWLENVVWSIKNYGRNRKSHIGRLTYWFFCWSRLLNRLSQNSVSSFQNGKLRKKQSREILLDPNNKSDERWLCSWQYALSQQVSLRFESVLEQRVWMIGYGFEGMERSSLRKQISKTQKHFRNLRSSLTDLAPKQNHRRNDSNKKIGSRRLLQGQHIRQRKTNRQETERARESALANPNESITPAPILESDMKPICQWTSGKLLLSRLSRERTWIENNNSNHHSWSSSPPNGATIMYRLFQLEKTQTTIQYRNHAQTKIGYSQNCVESNRSCKRRKRGPQEQCFRNRKWIGSSETKTTTTKTIWSSQRIVIGNFVSDYRFIYNQTWNKFEQRNFRNKKKTWNKNTDLSECFMTETIRLWLQ